MLFLAALATFAAVANTATTGINTTTCLLALAAIVCGGFDAYNKTKESA